jgi:hypothetical protein
MSREEYQSFLSFGDKPWDDERNLPEKLGSHPYGMMEYWKSGILRIAYREGWFQEAKYRPTSSGHLRLFLVKDDGGLLI